MRDGKWMQKNGKCETDGRHSYGVDSTGHATLNMGDGEEGRVGVEVNVLKLSGNKGLG